MQQIIVDGHNLIPKIPGLSLSDPDDEVQLIQLLQDYCRLRRAKIDCYFDKAPLGHPRIKAYGSVTARFARPGKTADAEIKEHLQRLERRAQDWIVVSSDGSIKAAARAARARLISSEDFAREIQAVRSRKPLEERPASEEQISEDELEMWMREFGENQSNQSSHDKSRGKWVKKLS